MAGCFTFMCCCEESLLIGGVCSPYFARPARTCWGKNDRSFARPKEHFLKRFSVGRTPPQGNKEVRCRTTARWSPCNSFLLGKAEGDGEGEGEREWVGEGGVVVQVGEGDGEGEGKGEGEAA